MKTDDQKLLGGLVLVGVACALFVAALGGSCAGPSSVAAQTVTVPALSATLALARTNVREAGTRAYLRDDGAAIHAVISFRAEHIYRTDYLSALLRVTNGAPTRRGASRPWITQLLPSNERPTLFPGHLRWQGRHGRWWRRSYEQAADIRRGVIEHQCRMPGSIEDVPAVPHGWGDFYDSAHFRRRNPSAVDLDCGQTCTLERDGSVRLDVRGNPRCNYFLHLPRYERRFGPS